MRPIKIYLFGSYARGDAGPDSDFEFCVVLPDDAPAEFLRPGVIRQAVRGFGTAIDVLPWRRTNFEQCAASVVASLPATIVREGRLRGNQPKSKKTVTLNLSGA
ncbi:MAG: nucleotidyltransferase domain-containing protein [Bryobacteraceae bacterium]|nr:nucleotidyltransferase domain-containing protein [Bryobacteraceae bacterium]